MKNKIITVVVGFVAFMTNAAFAMDENEPKHAKSLSPRGGRIVITSRPKPTDGPEESTSSHSPNSDEQKDAVEKQKSPRPPVVRKERSSSLRKTETQVPPPNDATSTTLTGSSTEKIEFEREKAFKETADTMSPGREADLSYEEPLAPSKEKSEKSVKKTHRGHLTSSTSDQGSSPKSERPSSKRHSQKKQPKPENLAVSEESTELFKTTYKSTRRESRSLGRRQKEEPDPLKSSSGDQVLLPQNDLVENLENLNENQVVDEVHRNPLEDKNHLNALLKSSEGPKMVSEEQKRAAQKLSAIQEIVNQNQAKESLTTIKIFGKSDEIHEQIKNKDDSYFEYFSHPKTEAKNHDVSMLVEPSKTDVYNKDFRLGNKTFWIEDDFENYQKSKVKLSNFIERDKTCTEMWDPHKKRDRYVIFNEFTAKPYYTPWPKPNYHHEIPIKLEKKESDVLPEKK